MATIRGYIAASLDGYIADPDGNLDWLTRYEEVDLGPFAYDRFIAGIRTVVMGRDTYDVVAGFDDPWSYADKRVIVVTSRPLRDPPGEVDVWSDRVDRLAKRLRALDDGDVWIAGGGKLQQAMIAVGALDRLELFIVPEVIGRGIPLFPPSDFACSVKLVEVNQLPRGMVRLLYAFSPIGDAAAATA